MERNVKAKTVKFLLLWPKKAKITSLRALRPDKNKKRGRINTGGKRIGELNRSLD